MSDQKKESAMEEKGRVSFHREQSVIKSISTSLEECECEKGFVNTKESEGKSKETLDIAHIFKSSSTCAYLEKQLLVTNARMKPSHHDLELLHDKLFFILIVVDISSSCASMWSKINILLESFVQSSYDERVSWFSWYLSDVFHAKIKGEFVQNCDYESSFLYASMKSLDAFIPSIEFWCFVSHRFEFPHDEQKVFIVDEFLKALLLGNSHGFQFYHLHFKEFMWLPLETSCLILNPFKSSTPLNFNTTFTLEAIVFKTRTPLNYEGRTTRINGESQCFHKCTNSTITNCRLLFCKVRSKLVVSSEDSALGGEGEDGVGEGGTTPGVIIFGITRGSSALTQESEGK
ncbi:hypothetical protein M9H77_35386 [Catharanthus roseus]|uniref:Uncharacterized protein n=1 Tax=Catharanthus roseus TaxID=4058 RepID=A0ACB9ZQ54_CATRO|nr:hypothetical protein M9H77_35386 [Catharanthus roseus]